MADRATISRVGKILARASSDNPAEAEAAVRGALARMRRDGVSFRDLLSLPEEDLYQATLVRLADLIVNEQADLSPGERREAYKRYLELVVEKFSRRGREGGSDGTEQRREDERDRMRREYEQRAREAEAQRESERQRESAASARGGSSSSAAPGGRSRDEDEPSTQAGAPFIFDAKRYPFSFSPATWLEFLVGESSFLRCMLAYPGRTVVLLLRSMLWAGGITVAGLVGLRMLVEVWWSTGPASWAVSWISRNFTAWLVVTTFVLAYRAYERGWYPRSPLPGRTDVLTVAQDFGRLVRALLWRYYGLWVWVMNRAVSAYRASRKGRPE